MKKKRKPSKAKKIIKQRAEKKPKKEELLISKSDLRELITELVGKEAIPIIDQLQVRGNASEFTLAEKLKLSINQFRNIIYKLDTYNLVSSTRKKDKKKGWYVYYWSFHPERLQRLYFLLKQKKLHRLKRRLEQEKLSIFFVCPSKDIRVPQTEALELNFRCPECGKLLQEDKSNLIKKLMQDIQELEEELKNNTPK